MSYVECDECRIKPGSPTLCADCLERRSAFYKTGTCRPPKVCDAATQERARLHDERMKEPLPPGLRIAIVPSPRPE